jgi:hypothetical protein
MLFENGSRRSKIRFVRYCGTLLITQVTLYYYSRALVCFVRQHRLSCYRQHSASCSFCGQASCIALCLRPQHAERMRAVFLFSSLGLASAFVSPPTKVVVQIDRIAVPLYAMLRPLAWIRRRWSNYLAGWRRNTSC